MPFDLAKVAMRVLALNAIGVLALNRTVENAGNDPSSSSNKLADHESHTGLVPDSPSLPDAKYHGKDTCMLTPSRPSTLGDVERPFILNRLRSSGNGATLVPNQQTVSPWFVRGKIAVQFNGINTLNSARAFCF